MPADQFTDLAPLLRELDTAAAEMQQAAEDHTTASKRHTLASNRHAAAQRDVDDWLRVVSDKVRADFQ